MVVKKWNHQVFIFFFFFLQVTCYTSDSLNDRRNHFEDIQDKKSECTDIIAWLKCKLFIYKKVG